ncbi:MAG TPA: hypothetical protein VML54_01230, partial [Candidatus Limnocylindrales bacterium]|nr:hypothetical protein [Candidatus Limnocylindrales bacterium]
MVGRQEARPQTGRPVEVEEEPPHRVRGHGRIAHGLGDEHRAGGNAALRAEVDAVERVPGRSPVDLEHGALELAHSETPPRRVGEHASLPPLGRPPEHAGGRRRHALIDGRDERLGLGEGHEPELPRRRERVAVGRALAGNLDLSRERGDAVAEVTVDRVLGSPEVRHRLAPLAAHVELGAHHAAEHA